MVMLLHNIDINGKQARLVTGVCVKARKARVHFPFSWSVWRWDQATDFMPKGGNVEGCVVVVSIFFSSKGPTHLKTQLLYA